MGFISWGSFSALILILISEMVLMIETASAKKLGELGPGSTTMPSLMTDMGEMLALSVMRVKYDCGSIGGL